MVNVSFNFINYKSMNHNITDKAKEHNLTYLGKGKPRYHIFKFNECGHTQEIRSDKFYSGTFQCSTCLKEKMKQEYSKNGLTQLKAEKNKASLFRINACGHTQVIRNDNARLGKFVCQTCEQAKHEQEAKENNVTILKYMGKNHYLYRLNECGHEKIICRNNLKRGSFECQECEETYRTKPSNIYLIKIKDKESKKSWVKLGVSKNTQTRIGGYGLKSSCEAEVLIEINFPTYNEATRIEKKIHSKYHNKKLDKEEMKKYLTRSGNTECYSIRMRKILLEELEPYFEEDEMKEAA